MGFLTKQKADYIPCATKLGMDELYEIATEFGRVSIGDVFYPYQVEIKADFTGDDSVWIRCRRYPDVKRNLADVIDRARKLKQFYREQLN